jgi:hypothetical protein
VAHFLLVRMWRILTCGGVNFMVLLPMESDRVPVSVQVLDVCMLSTSELAGTVVTVSDGNHYFPVTLVKCLQDLVHCGDVKPGAIVLLNNYITQNLSCGKLVVICLALSVIGFNEATIGIPSEYICPSIVSDGGTKIGTLDSSELCPHCEQIPCEWSVYGPTVVDSVRGQSPSSMGELFFIPCTRHVRMYLRHGIVILSFIHSFIHSVPWGIIFIQRFARPRSGNPPVLKRQSSCCTQ